MARTRVKPVAGVDGCPDGWLYVLEAGPGHLETGVAPDVAALIGRLPDTTVVAIDVPIGLTDAGQRACDRAARRLLGRPRSSSVFSAPIRAVLDIRTYREASDAHRRADGRGMSRQSFGIMSKIREIDLHLRTLPASDRARMHEAHPEVSFSLWNGGRPMRHAKKLLEGRAERHALIESIWPGAVTRLEAQLAETTARCAPDDLLDAMAALWTARRVRDGTATSLPAEAPTDGAGLRMAIVG